LVGTPELPLVAALVAPGAATVTVPDGSVELGPTETVDVALDVELESLFTTDAGETTLVVGEDSASPDSSLGSEQERSVPASASSITGEPLASPWRRASLVL
jgi:hypothetical protein